MEKRPSNTLADRTRHKVAPAPSSGWKVLATYLGMGTLVVFVVGILYFWDYLWPSALINPDDRPAPRLNAKSSPSAAPEGMSWVPGGEFYMGIDEMIVSGDDAPYDLYKDARHVHKVYVDGFWMDTHEVTNERFAAFVAATGYQTVAEKKPDPKEFPDVPAADLVPFSLVFKKPAEKVRNVHQAHKFHAWWDVSKGASWKHPEGPGSDIKGKEKYPVVHVCWEDAVAYCKWAGKRLPTEAEWEFAARGGLDRMEFAWGKDLKVNGKWMCNAWQGDFPNENTKEDGYEGMAPVGQYPPNGYGLHDMTGNVWEWCADWYLEDYYRRSEERNPKGPALSYDINEPGAPKRVQRGGSFLCADNYCRRCLPGARGKGEPTSAHSHVGFRCVLDAKR